METLKKQEDRKLFFHLNIENGSEKVSEILSSFSCMESEVMEVVETCKTLNPDFRVKFQLSFDCQEDLDMYLSIKK